MPDLGIENVKDIVDYLGKVETVRKQTSGTLWFRGVGKTTHELKPSLYRHPQKSGIENLIYLEKEILQTFRQRSIPFLERAIDDPWDWLFLMQHHGVPTRLLDWTESPMIGLFFAVTSAAHKVNNDGSLAFGADAAVWILDPVQWNRHSVNLDTFPGRVLSTNDFHLHAYKPTPECALMREAPLAIFGVHNSRRIVAQRGVFAVFGRDARPIEKFYVSSTYPDNILFKFILPKANLADFATSLANFGIVDSVAFPELEGLSREIKRQHRFEI